MYSQHDERSSTARTSATAAAAAGSTAQRNYQLHGYDGSARGHHHHHHQHARHLDGYGGSISTPSSSLENQRSLEHSTASTATATTTSLFGDPVLPATRHTDLLGGEDLYQNLKHNIEQYHAKLYSEQEKQRQAERDALFDRYASRPLEGGAGGYHRAVSAVGHADPTPMGDAGGSASVYGALPARSRSFARTQSAGLAADINGNRSNLLDLDLLKKNDWIDFTEHEYQHSLIPTNSRTVADVQQLASGIMSRRIENGVFQNPRAAAAARTLRRSSTTDSSLYGMAGGPGTGTFDERATFTVLGHGVGPYDEGGHAVSTSNSETNSEYERMLRYGRTDPSTAIIRDKINTGSNYRVSDARQHKNTAFTIINEVLPKSSSFDMAAGNRYSPYREKHQAASSRILSASSATGGIMPVHPGFYGYAYVGGESGPEDGGGSSIVSAPLGAGRRRLSHSDLSLASAAGRRPPKSKTSLSIPSKHPGRRQRGVLEVLHKKSTSGQPGPHSAKVTITQPSEDGRGSATPTPSETLSTGTTTDTEQQQRMVLIPEHQLRNLKLFGYKPFSSRPPPLSPVPDKGSMESSQADLKADGSASSAGRGKKDDKSTLRAPVFNIRGLLLSPRRASKSKEATASSPVPGDKQQGAGETIKEEAVAPAAPPAGSPPKKRRFNLARAIIDSARRGLETEPPEKQPPAMQPPAQQQQKGILKEKEETEGGDGEKRKALRMKLGIVRSGVRKDSEGNGVKEKKKGKGTAKGSKGTAGGKKDVKKKTTPLTARRGLKSGQRRDENRYDDDDYYDPYEDHDRGKKGKRKSGTGGGGGGMLKSALSYAASFRSKSKGPEPRPSTARGRKQTTGGDSSRVGPSKAGGGTPGSRRRGDTKSASRDRTDEGSRMTRGKSGSKQQSQQQKGTGDRVKSGKQAKTSNSTATGAVTGSMSRAKSAVGGRGRPLRRSSSAIAIDPGQQRKMNKLYEKNQKASGMMAGSTGGPSGGRATKNTSALVSERKAAAAGGAAGAGGLSKGDSRGDLRGKSASGKGKGTADGSSGGPGTPAFEKRDSDRSLKKSDSNRSLAMGGKGKKSDSKSSLLNKRTDSRSSLHQTAGDAGGDGASSSGLDLGKSPLSSLGGADGGALTDGGVKSARPTPKLTSKGSLLSLLSLKSGSKRNLDRGADATSTGQRPDTATTATVGAPAADGQMGAASTMRLQSASVRTAAGAGEAQAAGTDSGPEPGDVGSKAAGMNEKPPSTKPLRRLMSRGSMLSIKSIAHARSFTNVRPPTAGGAGTGGPGAGAANEGGTGTMTKVTEGSQEHDDTTDTETSGHGGKATGSDGAGGSMGVATHELTVAGDGEGEKVSNEYQGEPGGGMRSPMAEHRRGASPGPQDNVSSANTESMRDRMGGATGGPSGTGSNNGEFEDEDTIKCSKCCCACCTPCWTRTCLPFRRCFRLSGCCGGRLGKRKADGERTTRPEPQRKTGDEPERVGCWGRLLGCCRRCRNPKTSPETAVVARPVQQAAGEKKSCWQSLNCCSSCRRNKSRELVPRSSIDSDPADEEQQSRCRSCWSKLLCCCRPKQGGKGATTKTTVKRHKMEEPVEMETVKCCFCFKRQRPKVKAKPKRKVPVRSTFNCLSCCMMCCRKKGDNQSRRTSNLSKKQSIAPTIPPEDLRPKIDMSLVEHSSLMRGAIPVLPICLAYFCLFLNVVVPGSGTVLSGGLCLCIGKPRFSQHDSIKGRIGSFIINCIVGVSQLFTIIFCVVGWGWAIWWGTIMLRLARQHRKILEMEAAQDEGEEQTTLSNRTGGSNPPVALVSKTHRDVETGR
ncbi:protein stum [Anopheles aquasalis]|uniref:protein stum n=1 Tax=Anopheles aquasalis TaxID=42839 RepID=UPI00215B5C51|nr:protein stum [Anopheles aquasalis]